MTLDDVTFAQDHKIPSQPSILWFLVHIYREHKDEMYARFPLEVNVHGLGRCSHVQGEHTIHVRFDITLYYALSSWPFAETPHITRGWRKSFPPWVIP